MAEVTAYLPSAEHEAVCCYRSKRLIGNWPWCTTPTKVATRPRWLRSPKHTTHSRRYLLEGKSRRHHHHQGLQGHPLHPPRKIFRADDKSMLCASHRDNCFFEGEHNRLIMNETKPFSLN